VRKPVERPFNKISAPGGVDWTEKRKPDGPDGLEGDGISDDRPPPPQPIVSQSATINRLKLSEVRARQKRHRFIRLLTPAIVGAEKLPHPQKA
jgi:hypothetical protein